MGKNNIKKTQEEFELEMKELHPDILVIGKYINNKTNIKLKCLNDDYEWTAKPDNLLNGNHSGCPLCDNKVVVSGINDLATTCPRVIPLLADIKDANKYTIHSGKKICFKCPSCGETTKPLIIRNITKRGLTCRKCGDSVSMPNKIMYNLLQMIGIYFETESKFDWCNYTIDNVDYYGLYDFYFEINDKKYIVEMDGAIGHGNTNTPNRSKELTKLIDIKKDEIALQNGIEVIRINCFISDFDTICKNIINSKLNTLFNLNNINWNEIFINCAKSRVYKTCELWNSGITQTSEISKIMKMSLSSVLKDLKHGNRIGICNYTPEISREISKDRITQGIRNSCGKSVVCVTTGEIFNVMIDASRKYGNGKRLNIDACCNKTRKYAGILEDGTPLKWMYYDEYILLNEEDIADYLLVDRKISRSKKVICLNNLKIFDTIKDASEFFGINRTHISCCCNGKRKSCGKLENNIPIRWMYYDEYLKLNSNKESNFKNEVAFSM